MIDKPGRLVSIDIVRGITVAFMILVNNNGSGELSYRALNHAQWNGFTPTDLVFPTFLLIMGASLLLSKRVLTARAALPHILRRTVLLFLLGLVVNGFPFFHLGTLRIYGVLQRIAVCYLLASLFLLATRRMSVWAATAAVLLAGYWALLRFGPVPGHGVPVRDFPLLDPDLNPVAWLDRHTFPGRLYEGTRDPEGLLSDAPALATTLLGMLAGAWITGVRTAREKASGLLAAGSALVLSGALWNLEMPINKKLWTSSYVLYAGGWSLLLIGVVFYLVEVRGAKGRGWTPFVVLGTNAITAYVFSELLASAVSVIDVHPRLNLQQWLYLHIFMPIVNPAFGSLVYSLAFVLVCLLPVVVLYRRRIFLKL